MFDSHCVCFVFASRLPHVTLCVEKDEVEQREVLPMYVSIDISCSNAMCLKE